MGHSTPAPLPFTISQNLLTLMSSDSFEEAINPLCKNSVLEVGQKNFKKKILPEKIDSQLLGITTESMRTGKLGHNEHFLDPGHWWGVEQGWCPEKHTSLLRVIDQFTCLSIHLEVPVRHLPDPGSCGKGAGPSSCPCRASPF